MPQSSYDLQPDIPYKTTSSGDQLALDIFRPKGPVKATLLYAHGGGFRKGSRKDKTAARLAEKLCQDGVAVVSVDYRLNTAITAFPPRKRRAIKAAQARTTRVGMPVNPHYCGPRFYAAVEDLSDACAFIRNTQTPPGPLLAMGVSAGGIAALSLAFPPRGWQSLNQPNAVIGLCAAMVQPWRLSQDGLPSLLFHGVKDRIIAPENARFAARRAADVDAPLEVIITDTRGHNPQVDLFINGNDPDGQPWLNRARRMMRL